MAVTRARRQLTVVCDSQTVRNHDFLKSLVDYMSEHGEVRTAFEYLEDCVPQNYTRESKDKQLNVKDVSSTKQKSKNQGKKAEQEQKKNANKGKGESQNNARSGQQNQTTNSHHPKPRDAEQTESKRQEIKEQLLDFLKDQSKKELQFSSSLSSHERLLVHELSEELGLKHESHGEGKNRRVTVSRPQSAPENPDKEPEMQPAEVTPSTVVELEEKSEKPSQSTVDLKSLHMERMRREMEKREERKQQKQQSVKLESDLNASKKQSVKKSKGTTKGL